MDPSAPGSSRSHAAQGPPQASEPTAVPPVVAVVAEAAPQIVVPECVWPRPTPPEPAPAPKAGEVADIYLEALTSSRSLSELREVTNIMGLKGALSAISLATTRLTVPLATKVIKAVD